MAKTTAAVSERQRGTLRVLLDPGKSKVEAIALLLNIDKSLLDVLEGKHLEQVAEILHLENVRAANAKAEPSSATVRTEHRLRLASAALELIITSEEEFAQMRASIDALTDAQMPPELRESAGCRLSRFERALEKRTSREPKRPRKTYWHLAIKRNVDLAVAELEVTKAAACRLVSEALFKIGEGISAESVEDIHTKMRGSKID